MLREIIEKLGLNYIEVDSESEQKIVKLFRDGIEYKPNSGVEYCYLGVYCRYKLGNSKQAVENYRKGVEFKCAYSAFNLAQSYISKDEKDMGIEWFKKSGEWGLDQAFIKLADIHRNKKEFKEAAFYYTKARDMGNLGAMIELGNVLNDPTQFEKAVILASKRCDTRTVARYINYLKYPISQTNKDEIYKILETFCWPENTSISSDLFPIFQDVISRKTKVLCNIAYHYKNYNQVL